MGLFQSRQARKFRRVSIYTDESRERLQHLVEQVKRENGELPAEDATKVDPDKFRGTFSQFTPRAQRRRERGERVGWPVAVVVIVALIVIWHLLLSR